MDTIENLIIAIVKPLISQPDALTIKIEDTPEFLENCQACSAVILK